MITQTARDILDNLPVLKITRTELACRIGVTPAHLDQYLKDDGHTFLTLLQETRVRRAERLHGKVPQMQLAAALGFYGERWYYSFYRWRERHGLQRFRQLDIRAFQKVAA